MLKDHLCLQSTGPVCLVKAGQDSLLCPEFPTTSRGSPLVSLLEDGSVAVQMEEGLVAWEGVAGLCFALHTQCSPVQLQASECLWVMPEHAAKWEVGLTGRAAVQGLLGLTCKDSLSFGDSAPWGRPAVITQRIRQLCKCSSCR